MRSSTVAALRADLLSTLRRLYRAPGFACLVVGTLSLGAGINAAMFAVMDALLFRPPFDIADPQEVVALLFRIDGQVVARTHYPNFETLRASGAFRAVAAYTSAAVTVGRGEDATQATALLVSDQFFEVLRPHPDRGHFALGDAVDPSGFNRAIISNAYWHRHFGGQSSAIGVTLTVDEQPYEIVGIAPPRFQALSGRAIDLWLPLEHASVSGQAPRNWRENRGPFWISIVARLSAASSQAVAVQKANAALAVPFLTNGEAPAVSVETDAIVPGRGRNQSLESRVSWWLGGLSGFVLLIACANVSNLLFGRTLARHSEHLILLSVGASPADLMRGRLIDAGVMAAAGALGAFWISFLLRNAVAGWLSSDIPLSRDLWDVRTAGIMAGAVMVSFALICAVLIWQVHRSLSWRGLHTGIAHAAGVGRQPRRALLALQAGMCFLLLFLAGLFASSLHRVESLDLGVDLDRTIQLTLNLGTGRRNADEVRAIYDQVHYALAVHPNVERVALAEASPYMTGSGAAPWTSERTAAELWAHRGEVAYRSVVGPGYFSTVGARSLRGRDFRDDDAADKERVAIVNAPLADYLWPTDDAIGKCMWLDDAATCLRIIGVLGGVWKFSALRRDVMTVYLPLAQVQGARPGIVFIRSRTDPRSLLSQTHAVVRTLQPQLPAVRTVLLRDVVEPELRPWRLGAWVFSTFGIVALLMASNGLYAVVTMNAMLRLKEIAIRIAIGARWPQIIRLVAAEGLASVLVGLAAGAALAMIASRWLGSVMFETSPTDPVILLLAALAMVMVSITAIAVPTIWALRTDPSKVLRCE